MKPSPLLRRALAGACATLLLLCGAAAPAADNPLPAGVQAALDRAGVPAQALGAIVLPLYPAGRVWQHQADRPLQPASTMKLVTSIVALDRLGPNLRARTEVLSAAPLEGGTLRGDLVLRGGGDPDLGLPQVWQLLMELREQGIREIEGDLVLDRQLFRPARLDLGLPPFDEAPEFPYNVIPDALQFTGNLMALELKSDERNLQVRTVPALEGVEFRTEGMTLKDGRCAGWDDDWKLPAVTETPDRVVIDLRGAFPRGCTIRADLQLFDRNRLAGLTFAALWKRLGGQWRGQVREDATPAGARLLASRQSRPWGEVMRNLNKRSDNAHTRLLYLTLGALAAGADPALPTLERSAGVVRAWLAEQRIPDTGLVLDNGSGLSRSERITPRTLARMLQVAHRSRYAPDLFMSLPVAGVDSSLALKDSPAGGWARLKPGTLRNVVALAGTVPDPQGRPLAVVAMINHDDAAKARPALLALVDWVARGRPREDRRPALR